MDIDQYFPIPSTLLQAILSATIFATTLLLFHLIRKNQTQPPSPPEADGAWPIIGHLHLLSGPQLPHKVLTKMAEKHGPIFTIRIGSHRTLIVSNSDIAKECFTTNDKSFASRPKSVAADVLTYNYAMPGFSPYGRYWRESRKITMLKLLNNQRLEALSHVRESEVRTAVRELFELWANSGRDRVASEMKKWFHDITLNIGFRVLVGKRYDEAMRTSEGESCGDGDRCRKALRDFFEFTGSLVVGDAIPWLRWLDLGGHEKAMRKTAKELDRLSERWLEEKKRNRASGEEDGIDFMAALLSILDSEEFQNTTSNDADTINKAIPLNLILGATDTTSITMIWALSLLLNNRQVLIKAQQELDQQVGKDRQVNEFDLKNLVYLPAIVKETLRLYPSTPLLPPHESRENSIVAGYHVPARTRLLVNISKIHRDPSVWEDPDEFKPERFLSKNGKGIDIKGQSFEMLPFGSGRRICPGISFALQMMELSLAMLIQGFEITTSFDEPVDMSESPGLTNPKASPLDVLITPRLLAHVY